MPNGWGAAKCMGTVAFSEVHKRNIRRRILHAKLANAVAMALLVESILETSGAFSLSIRTE